MSDQRPIYFPQDDFIEIRFPEQKQGFLSRFRSSKPSRSFVDLSEDDRDLLFAIGDLRAWENLNPGQVNIFEDHLRISHDAAAQLSAPAAASLGLPSNIDLLLKTDVEGTLGTPGFKLHYEWSRNGRRETPRRTGAIVHTSKGPRRIPLWMKNTLDLADNFDSSLPLEDHWRALAEFRGAIEPEAHISSELPENREMARLAMTSFLRGLEVHVADRFSISPDANLGQFEVLPYSSRSLNNELMDTHNAPLSEAQAELSGEALAAFQIKLHERGARPAYRLGGNSYLVIDKGVAPVLQEMARVQKAPREERKEFIQNPRAFISEAVSRHLEESGAFKDLAPEQQEEMTEAISGPALIESREYSERVTGVVEYQRPATMIEGSGTTWLPEAFSEAVKDAIAGMPADALQVLHGQMERALETDESKTVEIAGELVAVSHSAVAAVQGEIERREQQTQIDTEEDETTEDRQGPFILDTVDNYDDLAWQADLSPRVATIPAVLPAAVRTDLHPHQKESFDWSVQSWQAGLPGILNADEQGLGKTLQTISFLTWLKEHMKNTSAQNRGPILIVAPTSLLRNWEQEVETHVEGRGFGTLVRYYGSYLGAQKRGDARGKDTQNGLPQLDLEWLDEAFEDGRAHRFWLLTTYTTLANYQHSFGTIPFSAMVMDEIQNIKNRSTLASKAVEAMNADFRLGLTGTPIENAAIDLWTIMERIAPGCLGSGSDFQERYSQPSPENMAELHSRVFKSKSSVPPLAFRRLKDEVAKDLPSKRRFLHPRKMPAVQAKAYDQAQSKLASGGPGAALKMLHHIRTVSVHPSGNSAVPPDEFVSQSARLEAVVEILHRIKDANERALVFIEHRNMQFRFAEIVRHEFGLKNVDVINGDTPIPRRQEIVNHFQRHLKTDEGFDLLILGPKAAGTGLTLTAATHVVHLSRWWNPAVEEQCNDRVHRIGQQRPVSVHIPMALHPELGPQSFDSLLQSLMQRKRRLAEQALWPMGDSQGDVAGLTRELTTGQRNRSSNLVADSMAEQFARDGSSLPEPDQYGSFELN